MTNGLTYYSERNHGERFPQLVGGLLPDWRHQEQLSVAPCVYEARGGSA